jgi:hypothetical protein
MGVRKFLSVGLLICAASDSARLAPRLIQGRAQTGLPRFNPHLSQPLLASTLQAT